MGQWPAVRGSKTSVEWRPVSMVGRVRKAGTRTSVNVRNHGVEKTVASVS